MDPRTRCARSTAGAGAALLGLGMLGAILVATPANVGAAKRIHTGKVERLGAFAHVHD